MRRIFVVGTLLLLGASPVLMKCQDEPRYGDEVGETGQLKLPLEATGRSGNRYRLRDGIFLVERRVSGSSIGAGGAGEEDSAVSTSGAVVTGVGGGSFTTGAAFGGAAGEASVTTGGGFGIAATSVVTTGGVATSTSGFGAGGDGGAGDFELERVLFSEDALNDPEIVARLRTGEYRVTLLPGWIMERITPEGDSAFVQAELVSADTQFTQIFLRSTSFVFYSFLVDGDEIIFGNEGDLVVAIDVEEVNNNQSFNRRSLFETNVEAVSQFNLEETLDALGVNAGLDANGQLLYQELIDSYATAPGNLPSAVHCGDENPGGEPTLNGYPIFCDRLEAQQFDNLGSWFATAVVNRIDLAPENAAHCGQQRIIFANNEPIGNSRMFIIVEAQLPNPAPPLGLEGCLPVAEFWRSLEQVGDAAERGRLLHEAFVTNGIPGFGPFMSAAHLTAGTGQIRTNNFNDFFWTLREFKVVEDAAEARVVPFPVAEAPHGPLWNDALDFPFGAQCRDSFLRAVDGVLSDNPAQMAFIVDHECKDAESPNDFFTQDYPFQLAQGSADGFIAELESRLEGTDLTPFDVARRAQFAGSCIGCHEEATGAPLGRGVQAPFSRGFVHVEEGFVEACEGGGQCFPISQALSEVFLPHRGRVLSELLGDGAGGAGGASGGVGGSGAFGTTTSVATVAGATSAGVGGASGELEFEPELASAELTVEQLVQQDEAAKDSWGLRTLGGQPAKVSH